MGKIRRGKNNEFEKTVNTDQNYTSTIAQKKESQAKKAKEYKNSLKIPTAGKIAGGAIGAGAVILIAANVAPTIAEDIMNSQGKYENTMNMIEELEKSSSDKRKYYEDLDKIGEQLRYGEVDSETAKELGMQIISIRLQNVTYQLEEALKTSGIPYTVEINEEQSANGNFSQIEYRDENNIVRQVETLPQESSEEEKGTDIMQDVLTDIFTTKREIQEDKKVTSHDVKKLLSEALDEIVGLKVQTQVVVRENTTAYAIKREDGLLQSETVLDNETGNSYKINIDEGGSVTVSLNQTSNTSQTPQSNTPSTSQKPKSMSDEEVTL